MRVLVCGGRGFKDSEAVFEALDALHEHHHPVTSIIQGGASGVDTWAAGWAFENKTECLCFGGKAAGPIRNRQMIREGKPDLVVAFPGGHETADMVRQAKSAGIKIATVERVV